MQDEKLTPIPPEFELYECKPYTYKGFSPAMVTQHTCLSRLRKASRLGRSINSPLLDSGEKCLKCPIGQKLIEEHSIDMHKMDTSHSCCICGKSEAEGAEFGLNHSAWNNKKYLCKSCEYKKVLEWKDQHKQVKPIKEEK